MTVHTYGGQQLESEFRLAYLQNASAINRLRVEINSTDNFLWVRITNISNLFSDISKKFSFISFVADFHLPFNMTKEQDAVIFIVYIQRSRFSDYHAVINVILNLMCWLINISQSYHVLMIVLDGGKIAVITGFVSCKSFNSAKDTSWRAQNKMK